ncbi:MAG: SH3 domain-containing protein [Proteobacteria bacterium]|nr:SH3 domain-containing protein [Pseudomonadota bacterium]MBU1639805.1 SH3 domain-containing protein [Pseudomonadota bacterium]
MIRKLFPTLLAFLLLATSTSLAQAQMVSVDADMINLRSGPGSKYKILWELGRGYPLKVIGSKGSWYRVVDFENDKGWVYKKLVDRTPHLVVKKGAINLRSGPGTGYKIVRQAKRGVVFSSVETKGDWVKVRHDEENVEGWIKRDLLWGW